MINKILFTLSSIILIAAFSDPFLYSQEQLVIDSLVTGKKYKVTLYNDKEIIGQVVKQDSASALIVTESGTVRVRKEDIFSVSRNTVPKLMKGMLSLGGGLLLMTGEEGHYSSNTKPGYSFQLTGLMPFSENKAIRLDLAYGRMKKEGYLYPYYYEYYSSEGEQTRDIYSMHVDFLFGDFKTDTKFNVYGLGGAGLLYVRESDYTSTYYNYYDSTYQTSTYPGENYTSFSLALGGGLRFKLNNRLGIYAEAQYNMSTYDGYFWFFGRGYFPIRGGFTYTFY
jgi:hypothetical protein